jgi:hypothetical protein
MSTTTAKRVPLYERLPEIHRIRDEEIEPQLQLKAYLNPVEDAFSHIHANIEALYHDLFIETCNDWVVPYIGDLLGVSALKGESRTLRADVADTIALRRRKGTLTAIERLATNLTGWGAHVVELRERLAWMQHLNHQRPDHGGQPPYRDDKPVHNTSIRRGGTMPLRSPAVCALLGTAFDAAPRMPDFRAPQKDVLRPNIPNLAIYLWRLRSYQLTNTTPVFQGIRNIAGAVGNEAEAAVCFDLHPLSTPTPSTERPVQLFNTGRHDPHREPPVLTSADQIAAPMLPDRLTSDVPDSSPASYVFVTSDAGQFEDSKVGLTILVPSQLENLTDNKQAKRRGECLCRWEAGLLPKLRQNEVVIDPRIGRLMLGVDAATATALKANANKLCKDIRITYSYGSAGDVGAHPISRLPPPLHWPPDDTAEALDLRQVDAANSLQSHLADLDQPGRPIIVQISDNNVHTLDLAPVKLARWLIIRAESGVRPIIRLKQSLSFQPHSTVKPESVGVRLEGVLFTRDAALPKDKPIIARAEIGKLEVLSCTLDPGSHRQRDGKRAPAFGPAIALPLIQSSDVSPSVVIQRTVTGGIAIAEQRYTLEIQDSIVDAGFDEVKPLYALTGSLTAADVAWACATRITNVTFFGRVRAFELRGRGGIFMQRLEVHHNQVGCLKHSCFSGDADRLPQNHAYVWATEAALHFTSTSFGDAAYAQLTRTSDRRILTRGPSDNEMGAWNFLQEAHRWANLHTRLREFMPVGTRPILLPLT